LNINSKFNLKKILCKIYCKQKGKSIFNPPPLYYQKIGRDNFEKINFEKKKNNTILACKKILKFVYEAWIKYSGPP